MSALSAICLLAAVPTLTAVNGTAEPGDGTVRFTASAPGGRFTLAWDFPEADDGDYVLFPSFSYDYNRGYTREKGRPDETAVHAQAGDLATPAVGLFFPRAGKGFLLFTEQEIDGKNIGYFYRKGRLEAAFPRDRGYARRYRWEGDPQDPPMALPAGASVTARYKAFSFPCASRRALLGEYFRRRTCVMKSVRAPESAYTPEKTAAVLANFNALKWTGDYYAEGGAWTPGWSGGAVTAYALHLTGDAETRARAEKTIDWLCRHQSAAGLFYRIDRKGVPVDPHFIRYSADALFRLCRMIARKGADAPAAWKTAARRCADALAALAERNGGDLCFKVSLRTAEPLARGGGAGAVAPAALLHAFRITGDPRHRAAAFAVADYLERELLDRGISWNAAGDAKEAADSESAYGLLESFVTLAEETRDPRWTKAAADAAHLFSTWVTSYAYRFPPESEYGRRRTVATGSVWANIQNRHAAPGICIFSGDALRRLGALTGDGAYVELLRDIVAFIPQCVSTADDPVYAYHPGIPRRKMPPGWISERVNIGEWEYPWVGPGSAAYMTSWAETAYLLSLAESGCRVLK